METLEEKIQRVTKEKVAIKPYNSMWPLMFKEEKGHLLSNLPNGLINRIKHFGSTAVPGLSAKPIIDMLVEVASLEKTRNKVAPILESQGYDYFWRPTWGDDTPPFYAWFIKRDVHGVRTHHIHMIENGASFVEHWDRLLFKDYLIEHPETAKEYKDIKLSLSNRFQNDRIAYTKSKTEFIQRVTQIAKEYYGKA
ncbi:MAG: GrpB family protein [Deltaproteobacteria bacterium]|nr:GrpB family protein [Deltaproteobacteria bacterium]MBW1938476.1 GrpB family protein [Deltaproteobacteria bacterium]MBW1965455.1 GrpB family protein [Deltaproteobacteria bacterium]MBW2081231.1 GrpB family protein [Deltaproteobacteria bacterium]